MMKKQNSKQWAKLKVLAFIPLLAGFVLSFAQEGKTIYNFDINSAIIETNHQNFIPDSLNKQILVNGELISASELKKILNNLKIDSTKYQKYKKAKLELHQFEEEGIEKQFLLLALSEKLNSPETIEISTSKGMEHVTLHEGLSQYYLLNGKEVDGIEIYFNDIESIEIFTPEEAKEKFNSSSTGNAILIKTKSGKLIPDPEYSKTIIVNGNPMSIYDLQKTLKKLISTIEGEYCDIKINRVVITNKQTNIIKRKFVFIGNDCEGKIYTYFPNKDPDKYKCFFDKIDSFEILNPEETLKRFNQKATIGSIVINCKK